jgi:hypothetical protein
MRNFYPALVIGALSLFLNYSVYSQSCPSGFKSASDNFPASAVEYEHEVNDEHRALGAEDGHFAKLDKSGQSELVLDFGTSIESGDQITVYFASYDGGKSTTAKAFAWTDAYNKSFLDQESTSQDKDHGAVAWTFTAGSSAPYLSIFYKSGEKLMVDAVTIQKSACFPILTTNRSIDACEGFGVEFCLDSFVSSLNISSDYTATIEEKFDYTSKGVYRVGEQSTSSDPGCCEDGKPDQLTFRYLSSNIIDNNQGDGKSEVTTYTNPNGQKVYIVANGESDPNDLSNAFFTGTLEAGEDFTFSQGGLKWTSNMYFHILDSSQNNVLQLVGFHTSCSAPIVPGDQFGTLQLRASARQGVECGFVESEECQIPLFYSPQLNYSGQDSIPVSVCLQKDGIEDCQTLYIQVDNGNSNCGAPVCDAGSVKAESNQYASDIYEYTDVDHKENAEGSADGVFAELDKRDKSELVLSYDNGINAGDVIDIYFASNKGGFNTVIEAFIWTNSTSKELIGIQATNASSSGGGVKWSLTSPIDGEYISIYYRDGEHVLLDAVGVTQAECFPAVDIDQELEGCKNLNINFCLDSILDQLGISSDYTVSLSSDTGNTPNSSFVISGIGEPNNGEDCCDNGGKPDKLSFRYVSSNVINNNQGDGKSEVTTYSNPNGQTVYIVANGESDPNDLSNPYYAGTLEAGETFTMDKNGGSWNSNTYFHILSSDQSTVLQLVRFHTSCSAPIVPGDQFGTLVLIGSEYQGAQCGNLTPGDCISSMDYSPNANFVGSDTVELEICLSKNGLTSCNEVPVVINVGDGNCSNDGCPIGFMPTTNKLFANGIFWKKDAKDEEDALGEPDGHFAKLEKKGTGEIVFDFEEDIVDGSEIEVYLASYKDDQPTKAQVYLWTDDNTWYLLGTKTIHTFHNDSAEKWVLTADRDAKYVSVFYKDKEKVMIDAVSIESSTPTCVEANAITGTVWEDVNRNQTIDPSEATRLGNVTVYLYQDANNNGVLDPAETVAIDSQLTDASGFYAFTRAFDTSKTVDSYIVRIAEDGVPGNGSLTTDNLEVASFTSAGNIDRDNDFGYALTASIAGNVGIDITGGSVTSDIPFEGVKITLVNDENGNGLVDSGEATQTTQTDQFGNYLFENLIEGKYIVLEEQPEGFTSLRDGDESNDGDVNDGDFTADNTILVDLEYNEFDEDNDFIEEGRDFGDLPVNYANSVKSAYNTYHPDLYLGSVFDSETSENTSGNADGDDLDNLDDEDGVTLPAVLKGGQTSSYTVEVFNNTGSDAYLNLFVDVDDDGIFDSDESVQVVVSSSSSSQSISVDFPVPVDAVSGDVFTRVRLSLDPANTPSGVQIAGEIEDYQSQSEPVPVDLIAFQGLKEVDAVRLLWSTAQEENNEGFEVERSYNNRDFEMIGFVNGKGNSSIINEYQFVDHTVDWSAEVVYYRLRQVDFDGKSEYHGPVAIHEAKVNSGEIDVYPNPTQNQFQVDLSLLTRQDYQIRLVDMAGVAVDIDPLFLNDGLMVSITTNHLRAGVYYIRIESDDTLITRRIMISR